MPRIVGVRACVGYVDAGDGIPSNMEGGWKLDRVCVASCECTDIYGAGTSGGVLPSHLPAV